MLPVAIILPSNNMWWCGLTSSIHHCKWFLHSMYGFINLRLRLLSSPLSSMFRCHNLGIDFYVVDGTRANKIHASNGLSRISHGETIYNDESRHGLMLLLLLWLPLLWLSSPWLRWHISIDAWHVHGPSHLLRKCMKIIHELNDLWNCVVLWAFIHFL